MRKFDFTRDERVFLPSLRNGGQRLALKKGIKRGNLRNGWFECGLACPLLFLGVVLFCKNSLLAALPASASAVIINEIYYDPPDKTKPAEFIELHNASALAADISGWKLTGAIEFAFPAGTVIAPGGFALAAENPAAFRTAFGANALGPWTGSLANEGERIRLENAAGGLEDEVDYRAGFPWPTGPRGSGSSMELLHPGLDNDRAGSWRESRPSIAVPQARIYLAAADPAWRYRKGTNEPAGAAGAWRGLAYAEDATWSTGQTPVGYGDSDDNTVLADMANNYTTVYLRRKFTLPAGPNPSTLQLKLNIDDGVVAWINGVEAARYNANDASPAFNATASAALEPTWQTFVLTDTSMLKAGENLLAIHALNQSASSSDLTIDAELRTPEANALAGKPTPGATNSTVLPDFSAAPPQIRQVEHAPYQPTNGQTVAITAKITDPDGVAAVKLEYQLVNPGQYVRKSDAAYETGWMETVMRDDGQAGDSLAGDAVFTAQLPASVQVHRRLVRYRITATDARGASARAPYADDEAPNFAYFVYDGAPGWRGASRPGTTPAREFPAALMNSLPIYHLIANSTDVSNSQWNGGFDTVRMWGTLVYDGEVYDHIQFHNRGEGSTYNTGKNKWRFHFNRARDFKARDLWGRRYQADWRVLNFNGCASPWASVNRGMAGLDEGVSFRLYELAGVPSSKTHYVHFRVIDEAAEASAASQYTGDLWGLYQAIEQPDGRFLDERGLPDGNLYKIEGGGDKKNQGPSQPADASDWNSFSSASRNAQTAGWWRANLDLERFYSFHAMNRVTGNVDLRHNYNHYAYHPPGAGWVIMPWDLDMMFLAMTHWPGVVDQNNALSLAPLALEFRNRCREILDLMCSDASDDGGQIGQLIDEFADIVNPAGLPLTWADVDEAMWNWHPRAGGSNDPNGQTNHKGNFYRTPYTDSRFGGSWTRSLAGADFEGFVKFILDYCTDTDPNAFAPGDGDQRGYGYNYLELEAKDAAIPQRPVISYSGQAGFPVNALRFQTSAFADPQGANTFGAMKWRLAEISNPSFTNFAPGTPRKYEIEPAWESPEITAFAREFTLPAHAARAGSVYRVRVRHKDSTGRWSHWSQPVQFTAGAPEIGALVDALAVTELMFNPVPPNAAELNQGFDASDFEFIELKNISASPVDLAGVRFTRGVDFAFPAGATLPADSFAVIAGNANAFRARYGANLAVLGQFAPGRLDNSGEEVRLAFGLGTVLRSFTYDRRAPWPDAQPGRSLVLIAPDSNPGHADPENWRPSASLGGSPGSHDALKFSDWLALHEIAAANDDSDLDGLSAFLEYAAGSNPRQPSPPFTPAVEYDRAAPALKISLTQSLAAEEARAALEISSNLQEWTPASGLLIARSAQHGAQNSTYALPIQATNAAVFVRLSFRRR